jgi:Ser/Thr protein kinase RdoA (MazF antagonist)
MDVMLPSDNPLDPHVVLRSFPEVERAALIYLGNRGGFSGAALWRVETPGGLFCLKAWPGFGDGSNPLERIHSWMALARRAGLSFVPRVHSAHGGNTCVRVGEQLWDLTDWMPGAADFHSRPTVGRLAAAGVALAQIHSAWQEQRSTGVCPSIERRLQALTDWNGQEHAPRGPLSDTIPDPDWSSLLTRARDRVKAWSPRLEGMLSAWRGRPVALQPCIGDVWHDHVFFQQETVSGVIDYGSARMDHPATDVGRLLGSLVGDEDDAWSAALAAYRSTRPFPWEAESLARLLDRSGVIVSLLNWIRWLGRGERTFADPQAVTQRLRSLVERVEGWRGSASVFGA